MQTITVMGRTLFDLAAQFNGDATQWDRWAQLNLAVLAPNGDVPDPWLTGINNLQIPSTNLNAGGGVYVITGP